MSHLSAPTPGASAAASSAASATAAAAASVGDKRPRADVAADRRVQPRHFHAGPHSQPGDDAIGTPAAASAAPPVTRLHRHALESIFAFSKLSELATLMSVSREWQSAVLRMKPLDELVLMDMIQHLYENPLDGLTAVCSSRLRRHIQWLNCFSFSTPSSALHMLSQQMPRLEELSVIVAVTTEPPPTFPARLRKLRLVVESRVEEDDPTRVASFNHMMNAIGSLPLLTDLEINSKLPVGVSLSALARLPLLRRLELRCRQPGWSDEAVAVLRSLVDLESVNLLGSDLPLVSRLLAQPHSLRWQELQGFGDLTEPIVQLLITLPLTKLNANLAMPHIDFMTQLLQLTNLHIYAKWRSRDLLDRERIFNTLSSLVQLRLLELCDDQDANGLHFSDADLLSALPRLTQLQSLKIRCATELHSLSFLTQGMLPRTLTDLCLWNFNRRVPVAELKHVLPLTNLESLRLHNVFDDSIDHAGGLSLQPPMRGRTFPNLKTFYHWNRPKQIQSY